jgi:predicted 3-demethylubiquinone-9 3-methyltransferase (glyoxalase superfamily)
MAELEHAWETLLAGGQVLMPLATYEWSARYGWLQDQFNISWQLSLGKLEEVGQKFTPTLLFANQQASQAEPAIQFYTGIFHNSSVMGILKYNENSNEAAGRIKHAQFKLGQQVFMALDSSLPHSFIFTEGISLVVNCETQAEIDYYWNKLTEGGKAGRCGWLKDKYGVSWQIVPVMLGKLMRDPEKGPRVMQAFLQMTKFDLEKLMNA